MDAVQTWDAPRPVKLTIDDFLRLNDAGAFDAYSRTELIDGMVVAMNSQLSTHARVKSRLFRRLADAIDTVLPGYEAWAEASTAIPPINMPEPDIVVTCFEASGRLPVPVDTVQLVVEVADTTLGHDIKTKGRLYATAAIPEYWVVDANGEVVHRFWSPAGDRYADHDTVPFGVPLTARTIADLTVSTAGL